MRRSHLGAISVALIMLAPAVHAQEPPPDTHARPKKTTKGILFAEYFVDSREASRSLTMEGFSNGVLGDIGLDMFGFVDFIEAEGYYVEGRVVRPVLAGIGPAIEVNDGTGPSNETLRYGLVGKRGFELYEGGSLLLVGKLYPYNTDTAFENKKAVQAAFSFDLQLVPWLSFNGFYDHNFLQDAEDVIVTEDSIDIDVGKLVGWDALVGFKPAVELRYNGFLPEDKLGVAGGLRLDLMAAVKD